MDNNGCSQFVLFRELSTLHWIASSIEVSKQKIKPFIKLFKAEDLSRQYPTMTSLTFGNAVRRLEKTHLHFFRSLIFIVYIFKIDWLLVYVVVWILFLHIGNIYKKLLIIIELKNILRVSSYLVSLLAMKRQWISIFEYSVTNLSDSKGWNK